MKFNSLVMRLFKLIAGEKKVDKLCLLRQQRVLLHKGLDSVAEVMDAVLLDDRVGGRFPVRLWLKLKKTEGGFIYTHTKSLVSPGNMPGKGELLRIKYLPGNLSSVLIL
jgi:hypothetical protein